MGRLKGDAKAGAAATGARTVPPREHGGNCDTKDLSRGAPDSFVALLRHFGVFSTESLVLAQALRAAWTCRSRRICSMPAYDAPTADRSRCCGRWRSSTRHTPVRSAARRRLVRFWWRRRCRAWTRLAAPPLPPTSVVPMHRFGTRAILQGVAAALAPRCAPTRLAQPERNPVSALGCLATDCVSGPQAPFFDHGSDSCTCG
jgi:hypothetical protein